MPNLPILSGKSLIKIFEKIGYTVTHQRGSHVRLFCAGKNPITIPDYPFIDRSLLKKILREADMSSEEFMKLL